MSSTLVAALAHGMLLLTIQRGSVDDVVWRTATRWLLLAKNSLPSVVHRRSTDRFDSPSIDATLLAFMDTRYPRVGEQINRIFVPGQRRL